MQKSLTNGNKYNPTEYKTGNNVMTRWGLYQLCKAGFIVNVIHHILTQTI